MIDLEKVRLEKGWKTVLQNELLSPYFADIKSKILEERAQGVAIFPPAPLIFHAFDATPFDKVRAVILGQDPYHQKGQAMGLSFSVPDGVRIPPSLRNIYQELSDEYPDFISPHSGDLSHWAQQGVLLLNATLTVREGQAASHSHWGWQRFTDAAIQALSNQQEHIVFMLWGNFAKAKASLIDGRKHCILTAAHPSPLARGAFFGCNHFRLCNDYLTSHSKTPIDWQL